MTKEPDTSDGKVQWFGLPPDKQDWIPGPFDADLDKDNHDKFENWKEKQMEKLMADWHARMANVNKEVDRQRDAIEELQEQLEDAEGQLGALRLTQKEEQQRRHADQQYDQQIEDGVYH